jgi:hypothetical protein
MIVGAKWLRVMESPGTAGESRVFEYFQGGFGADEWPLRDMSNGDDGDGALGQRAQAGWTLKPTQAQSEPLKTRRIHVKWANWDDVEPPTEELPYRVDSDERGRVDHNDSTRTFVQFNATAGPLLHRWTVAAVVKRIALRVS